AYSERQRKNGDCRKTWREPELSQPITHIGKCGFHACCDISVAGFLLLYGVIPNPPQRFIPGFRLWHACRAQLVDPFGDVKRKFVIEFGAQFPGPEHVPDSAMPRHA